MSRDFPISSSPSGSENIDWAAAAHASEEGGEPKNVQPSSPVAAIDAQESAPTPGNFGDGSAAAASRAGREAGLRPAGKSSALFARGARAESEPLTVLVRAKPTGQGRSELPPEATRALEALAKKNEK